MTEVVQPETGQGAPEPVAVAPLTGTPWADDVNLLFSDADTRSKVDEYLRTKIQPHTTKLEQDLAGLKDAQEHWNTWSENPAQAALNALANQFGPDAANEIGEYLNAQIAGQQANEPPVAQLDPRVMQQFQEMQEQLAAFQNQQAESAYDAAMNTAISANPDIDPADLAIFVAQTEDDQGLVDFDQGIANYRAFTAKFGTQATSAQQASTDAPAAATESADGELQLPYPDPKTTEQATANLQAIMRAQNEANRGAPKTL